MAEDDNWIWLLPPSVRIRHEKGTPMELFDIRVAASRGGGQRTMFKVNTVSTVSEHRLDFDRDLP
jgi:hypothetical protein